MTIEEKMTLCFVAGLLSVIGAVDLIANLGVLS